jgi:hypothetical protein
VAPRGAAVLDAAAADEAGAVLSHDALEPIAASEAQCANAALTLKTVPRATATNCGTHNFR